jgi:ribosomal protein S18 acetylase RimI-like enzyme
MDDVSIRPYVPADKNAVWEVHDRAFRAAPVPRYPELNRHLRHVPDRYLDPGGEFLVATVPVPPAEPVRGPDGDPLEYGRAGERVVGLGAFLPSTVEESTVRPGAPVDPDSSTVEIRSVRVDPEFQRRGIARSLMTELHDRARERGFERAVLDTGVDMDAAQRLYESLEYERVGRESFLEFELVYYERPL